MQIYVFLKSLKIVKKTVLKCQPKYRAIGSGNNTPHFSSSGEFCKLHTDRLHCETQQKC